MQQCGALAGSTAYAATTLHGREITISVNTSTAKFAPAVSSTTRSV